MSRLEKEEVFEFGKYIRHAYHGEHNALKLFKYYKRFLPENASSPKLGLSYAFEKIYGREMRPGPEDPKKLWNDMSKVYLWLKDFLILKSIHEDEYVFHNLWLRILFEKNITQEQANLIAEMHGANTGKPHPDMGAFQRQMEVSLHYRKFLMQDRPSPDQNALPCILEIKESSDLISLKMECERLTLQSVKPSKKSKGPNPVMKDQPLVLIYKEILPMLTTGDARHYFEMEVLLKQYSEIIATDETLIILRYMQNFAARMVRKGDDIEWGKRYHEMNKTVLEKEQHVPKGIMPAANFLNIVNAACAVPDLPWAREFKENYAQFLPQKIRPECVLIAEATIAFEEGSFEDVVEQTKKPKFKEETHIIRAKTLQLRALYELRKDASNAILAFNTYLDRHRMPKTAAKEAAISFMKVFTLLYEAKVSKQKLLKTFEANPELYFRSWLSAKIDSYNSAIYGQDRKDKK